MMRRLIQTTRRLRWLLPQHRPTHGLRCRSMMSRSAPTHRQTIRQQHRSQVTQQHQHHRLSHRLSIPPQIRSMSPHQRRCCAIPPSRQHHPMMHRHHGHSRCLRWPQKRCRHCSDTRCRHARSLPCRRPHSRRRRCCQLTHRCTSTKHRCCQPTSRQIAQTLRHSRLQHRRRPTRSPCRRLTRSHCPHCKVVHRLPCLAHYILP